MLISIDERTGSPIYLQIVRQVKEKVRSGLLKPGDELPSVRELAKSLGINLHTVRGAYQKLREWGIINMRLGRRAKIENLPQPSSVEEVEASYLLWLYDQMKADDDKIKLFIYIAENRKALEQEVAQERSQKQ